MRTLSAALVLASLALALPACDQSSGGGGSGGTSSSGGSKSMLGKSRDMAKDVVAAEGQHQAQVGAAADQITGGGQLVQAGPLAFPLPGGWRSVPPASSMRAAEMRVGEGNEEILVTFMVVGGTVESNIDRWKGQMKNMTGDPVDAKVGSKTVSGMPVTTIEMYGVFTDMMSGAGTRPDYGFRGAVIEIGGGQLVTVKMTGPQAQMEQQADGWAQLTGGFQAK